MAMDVGILGVKKNSEDEGKFSFRKLAILVPLLETVL